MKPILVATDFSELSYSATRYAIAIARETKARLKLLHIYQVPVPPVEMYVNHDSAALVHDAAVERLKEMVEVEKNLYGDQNLNIEYEARAGFVPNEILNCARHEKVGLIVMGTHGESGLKKIFFGSNTGQVIADSTIPVLAVPEKARYLRLKKFVFAADLHNIRNNRTFDVLVETALLFDAEIRVLSVRKNESDIPDTSEAFEAINIDQVLEKVNHSFHTEFSDDVVGAIDEFIRKENPDLVATVPQKHGYFDRIFNKSVTLNLIHSSGVPVLCLPDHDE
jgi:nucleotide-binding universal stress UspA family protein